MYAGTGINQGAQNGVDGITSPDNDPRGMFITNADPKPWWQVDLQSSVVLDHLRAYNRINAGERARTMEVLLSDDGTNWRSVYKHNGTTFKVLDVDLKGQKARYVRLQLNEAVQFHLMEVEVYAR